MVGANMLLVNSSNQAHMPNQVLHRDLPLSALPIENRFNKALIVFQSSPEPCDRCDLFGRFRVELV
jgi:hypothetical protein